MTVPAAEPAARPDWAARAAAAERAVLHRHLRRLWGLPGTALGVISWPAAPGHRLFLRWHFWWQAHLLDCAVDALRRDPTPGRRAVVRRIARSIRLRNLGRWTNPYYDDIAWLGLALQRAGDDAGSAAGRAVDLIAWQLLDAWTEPGGIPWRRGDEFRNTPANGPAAILLARAGHRERARATAEWIERDLLLPNTFLIADGIRADGRVEPTAYSYGQGVVLGAELELTRGGGDRSRIHRLVGAVQTELSTAGVLFGHGGGDGGLFTGILARYLALVALELPGDEPADRATRAAAADLVLTSAAAAWQHAGATTSGPLFGPDWRRRAVLPGPGTTGRTADGAVQASPVPERDLSVQLAGWMLTEAAARVAAAPSPLP